jgi:hypothetical protein
MPKRCWTNLQTDSGPPQFNHNSIVNRAGVVGACCAVKLLDRIEFLNLLQHFFHIIDGKIVFQRGYWDKHPSSKLHGSPVRPKSA